MYKLIETLVLSKPDRKRSTTISNTGVKRQCHCRYNSTKLVGLCSWGRTKIHKISPVWRNVNEYPVSKELHVNLQAMLIMSCRLYRLVVERSLQRKIVQPYFPWSSKNINIPILASPLTFNNNQTVYVNFPQAWLAHWFNWYWLYCIYTTSRKWDNILYIWNTGEDVLSKYNHYKFDLVSIDEKWCFICIVIWGMYRYKQT